MFKRIYFLSSLLFLLGTHLACSMDQCQEEWVDGLKCCLLGTTIGCCCYHNPIMTASVIADNPIMTASVIAAPICVGGAVMVWREKQRIEKKVRLKILKEQKLRNKTPEYWQERFYVLREKAVQDLLEQGKQGREQDVQRVPTVKKMQ